MNIIPTYDELSQLKTSRLILTLGDPALVSPTALFCRSLLADFPCRSYFCTCYINDPEKADPKDKNRVHIGLLWSNETTQALIAAFESTMLKKLGAGHIGKWEHFPTSDASFLIHFIAREYGEFLLSASESLGHVDKNFVDGIHLVYNQLLLVHGDLTPKASLDGFLNQVYTNIHDGK